MSNYIPYPYPVIGNGDEISGGFTPKMDYSLDPVNAKLDIKFKLTNSYFSNLIENGQASFVVDVSCPRTYFRKTYETAENALEITEPSSTLRGKVDVAFYICTKEELDDYSPVHDDETYCIEAGDVIGIGGDTSFDAVKQFNPLKAPIKSIIKVVKTDQRQDAFDVLYNNDDFVTIRIPTKMYDAYASIRSVAPDVLHAALVLPALMDIIDTAQTDECANSSWAQKLAEICDSHQIGPDDEPLIIAQKILDNPLMRSLDWCNKIIGDE